MLSLAISFTKVYWFDGMCDKGFVAFCTEAELSPNPLINFKRT